MAADCPQRLHLLTAYDEAIVRCYGRQNGMRLKETERDAAYAALKAAMAAYQEHIESHRCVPQEPST